jgi:DNA-binding GntR family transcriptional regulator
LHHRTARFAGRTPTGIAQDREIVWAVVDPWLPLAQQRLSEASDSPSDQARWQRLIKEAGRPACEHNSPLPKDLVLLVSAARQLLRALMDAERSGPRVHEIAATVRRAIQDRDYQPGSTLGLRRIAADTAAPSVERVALALQDLQSEGLVVIDSYRRTRVASGAAHTSRPEHIAAWLCFLIRSGVYPPSTALPNLRALARLLVCSSHTVTAALRLLVRQQVLAAPTGRRYRVCATPPFAVARPADLTGLVRDLRERTASDRAPTAEKALLACRQTQVWWSRRVMPPAQDIDDRVATLIAACATLVARIVPQLGDDQDLQALLRQATVTAAADQPTDTWERTWRAASLGALVRTLHRHATAHQRLTEEP